MSEASPGARWRRLPPLAWALVAAALSLLAAFIPTAWHMLTAPPGHSTLEGAEPWRITIVAADGSSRVMGLHLGVDTLAGVQARLGDGLRPAVVARLGEPGALEALADPFNAGFVAGRLVLAFDAPAEAVARWRAGAPKSDVMEGGARSFTLSAQALQEAGAARLVGASFLPGVSLGADDVTQRFGAPAAVHRASEAGAEGAQTWLYPERGLAITFKPGSRAVLQYVVPAEFDRRLRAPLDAAR